jgi:hypothetical protein
VSKTAILICGFQNWGKSSTIQELFGQERFFRGSTYQIEGVPGIEFLVESKSNDDYGFQPYIDAIKDRIAQCPNKGKNILAAFCPTREEDENESDKILSGVFKSYDVHLMCLEYKWDGHAKLLLNDIQQYYSSLKNVQLVKIGSKNPDTRPQDVIREIKKVYGL